MTPPLQSRLSGVLEYIGDFLALAGLLGFIFALMAFIEAVRLP